MVCWFEARSDDTEQLQRLLKTQRRNWDHRENSSAEPCFRHWWWPEKSGGYKTRWNTIRNNNKWIRTSLNSDPSPFRDVIERGQLRWFGHVNRMREDRYSRGTAWGAKRKMEIKVWTGLRLRPRSWEDGIGVYFTKPQHRKVRISKQELLALRISHRWTPA